MAAYTLVHVLISLVAIATGFYVAYGLLTDRSLPGPTAIFLATTVLTSVTGFGFPATHVTPGHVIGVISLVSLGFAIYARYSREMEGTWRVVYVSNAILSLYLNFFVLIVQSFQKVPALQQLAPTQTEAPFALVHLAALVAFAGLTTLSLLRFRRAQILAT